MADRLGFLSDKTDKLSAQMPKPPEIIEEFTRASQWTAAQTKVWTKRLTRKQIAKLMAENQALRQMAERLVAEIALRAKQG